MAPAQTDFFCGSINECEAGILPEPLCNAPYYYTEEERIFGRVSNMIENRKYKKTLVACYLGFVTQAISANFAPLLFLTFQDLYKISLEQIALIPVVFYLTQLLIDLGATKFADKLGYRICVVISQIVSAVGLVLLRQYRTEKMRNKGKCGKI